MQSKINPALEITDDKWVISIIKRKRRNHALLIVESKDYSPGEGYCIRWFDLMPNPRYDVNYNKNKYKAKLDSLFISIKNDVRGSCVRYCPTYGFPIEHPEELSFRWHHGQPLMNAERIKNEDFLKVFLVGKKDSWAVDASKAKLMIADIMKDMAEPPKFQINGGPTGVNCMTWLWKKLEIAGINAKHHNLYNLFGVQPSHNIEHVSIEKKIGNFFHHHHDKKKSDASEIVVGTTINYSR